MVHKHTPSCHAAKKRFDFLLWGSFAAVVVSYLLYWQFSERLIPYPNITLFSQSVFEFMNTIWWGIAIGILMVAILTRVPREFVIALLGTGKGIIGILRAAIGGVFLDLCSHGILMVAAKLYERGVTTGQVMAFLIASPWNSFSLTLILITLVGLKWTLLFIVISMIIAVITGYLFDYLIKVNVLPANPHTIDLPHDFDFFYEAKTQLKSVKLNQSFLFNMFKDGVAESRMVMRWILFGVILAALVRTLIDTSTFETYFGPTLAGLWLTVLAATVLEVCSEGSTPIAADLLNRANAPGNSFAFLMAGVSTDYTEIMVIKDTTKSWKVALFLPLITLPQIILIAWFIN